LINAAIFLDSVCKPNVEAFARNPTSFQHAWNALTSLSQFIDYLANDRGKKSGVVRAEIERRYPPSAFVRDIGDAYKHFAMTHRERRKGLSVIHTDVGVSAAFSDGSYFSDGTSFADAQTVLRSKFEDELVDLSHLARNCLDYFASECRTE
jgi:hypothetical protein